MRTNLPVTGIEYVLREAAHPASQAAQLTRAVGVFQFGGTQPYRT